MKLNELRDNPGSRKARRLVGRGIGSGLGKTSGRGHKGQKARKSCTLIGFEGGQMPLYRRMPKRGFKNPFRVENRIVNVCDLEYLIQEKKIDVKKTVNEDMLIETGIIRDGKGPIKLLGYGEVSKPLTVEVNAASAKALEIMKAAGGKVQIIGEPQESK